MKVVNLLLFRNSLFVFLSLSFLACIMLTPQFVIAGDISDVRAKGVPLHDPTVGITAGEHSVGSDGSANYTIPINIIPGIAGMQPDLALSYNQNAGNGALGVGWSMSGLSSIGRCANDSRRREYHGSYIAPEPWHPVDFSNADKLCYNGVRMVLISGIYGELDSEYRLASESFTKIKITQKHGFSHGPHEFKVWTKDGMIRTYGGLGHSALSTKVDGNGNESFIVAVWSLAEVQDRYGNYYAVEYEKPIRGSFRIKRIRYTGHKGKSQLNLPNRVDFIYEGRTDNPLTFASGAKSEQTWRLASIANYSGDTKVREYQFEYSYKKVSTRSFLTSVTECAGNHCLPPTRFSWSGDSRGFSSYTKRNNTVFFGTNFVGNFDKDGFDDLYSIKGKEIWVYRGNKSGNVTKVAYRASHDIKTKYLFVNDFNRDGRDDVAYMSDGDLYIHYATATSFQSRQKIMDEDTSKWGSASLTFAGDYSGTNGGHILTIKTGSSPKAYLKLRGGFVSTEYPLNGHGSTNWNDVWQGDFNGDGYSDIARRISNTQIVVYLWTGNGFISNIWNVENRWGSTKWIKTGDFNGDGLTDIASHASANVYMKLSTGTGFKSETWTITGSNAGEWCDSTWVFASDFNSDGLTDFGQACKGQMYMKYSAGRGFKGETYSINNDWGERNYAVLWDFNGDGAAEIVSEDKGALHIKRPRSQPIRLVAVTSGSGKINHQVSFSYKSLNDSTVYTAAYLGYDTSNLLEEKISPEKVVSAVRESNGRGGQLYTDYQYMGLVYERFDAKRLGFQSMSVTNRSNGVTTTTYTNQDSFNKTHGLVDSIVTKTPDGTILSRTANNWEVYTQDKETNGYRDEIRLTSTSIIKHDWNGFFLSFELTEYSAYNHGTPGVTKTRVFSGGSIYTPLARTHETTHRFTPANYDGWLLPAIRSTEVSIKTHNNPTIVRKTEIDTDPATGKVIAERTYSDENVMTKEVKYENINSYGDHEKTTVSGPDFSTRSSTTVYQYGSNYNHLERITKTQAINTYVTQQSFVAVGHQNAGLLNITTDINDFQTKYYYDAFGRQIKSQRYHNSLLNKISSYSGYQWCTDISDDNYCQTVEGNKPYYRIAKTADASPMAYTFYDQLGREVRRTTQGPDGRYINILNLYNSKGYNYKVSEPYYTGDSIYYTEVEHDGLGRIIRSTSPDGRVDTVTFNALARVSLNDIHGATQSKKEYRNAIDELVRVEDNVGTEIHYEYDSESKLLHTYMEAGSTIQAGAIVTYDALGRKKTLDDPDKGLWSYTYNGLDQLITQTNARGETTCNIYDALGRRTLRVDDYTDGISLNIGQPSDSTNNCKRPSGSVGTRGTGVWQYNNHAGSKPFLGSLGMFYSVSQENGASLAQYTVYAYDDKYGRLEKATDFIDNTSYITETTYDRYHRPETVTYPGITSNRLKVTSLYNDIGFNYRLKNTATGKIYYDVKDIDAYGNVTAMALGNGVSTRRDFDPETNRIDTIKSYGPLALTSDPDIQDLDFDFDKIGNLTYRNDALQNIQENAGYDTLNRLTYVNLDMGASRSVVTSVTYNPFGNIATKTGVGTYRYGQSGCGNNNAGPHAVTSITSPKNTTYCYDANGNMVSGDGRTLQYATFDKPIMITKGNHSTELFYNANRTRYKRIDKLNGVTTTYRYAGAYEHVLFSNREEERHYVGDSIIITKEHKNSRVTEKERYLHKDHIGSITAITNSAGIIEEEFSFDPWGKRRAPSLPTMESMLGNWNSISFYERANLTIFSYDLKSGITNKGFTGHEQMDGVGLIHMGGRVYDAEIGRFISADPFIQDSTNTQAFNRYSYVENNPLSYTDPSGYFLKKVFKKLVSAVRSVHKKLLSSLKGHLRFLGRIINAVPGLDTVIVVVGSIICPLCAPWLSTAMTLLQSAIAYANGAPLGSVMKGLAVGLALSGANLGGAGKFSGITAKIGKKLGSQAVAGALVSGAMAKANGGKVIDGIKSYAKGAAISAAANMIGTAIGNSIGSKIKPAASAVSKASGNTKSCNPINIATGEKYLTMRDYEAQGASKLKLERYYSSVTKGQATMGVGWRTNFDKTVTFSGSASTGYFRAVFTRAEGDAVEFVRTEDDQGGSHWKNVQSHRSETIEQAGDLWKLHLSDNSVETYNADGQLLSVRELGGYTQNLHYINHRGESLLDRVEDSYGQSIVFSYDYKQRIRAVIANGQTVATYQYDLSNNLAKATAVDGTFKAYHYDDNRFNHAITSITNHQGHKLHTMAYDAAGRAVLSALGDDAERYDIVFEQGPEYRVSTVTNSAGKNTVYTFNDRNQPIKIEGDATATCLAANQGYTYNDDGRLLSKVDWNDAETRYQYNDRGLETLRIEAVGTEQERRIATQWHADFRLPVRVEIPGLVTLYDYDGQGLLVKRTLRDITQKRTALQRLAGRYHDRTWAYTYNAQGLLATTDGPIAGDADITTYAYNAQGNLTTAVNALGHQARTLAFNERGLPTLVEDTNRVQTELRYNNRGWLTHKVLKGDSNPGRADEVTEYRYTGASDYLGKGLVSEVISSNGQSLHYAYDKARRLISQTNSQGERIEYTLDLEGNRTAQTVYSQTGEIVQQTRAVYDELSRLLKTIGADNRVIADYHYDKAGNQTQFADALGRETHYAYDVLNRLVASSDVDGTVKQAYNVQDQLTYVTDQRGLTTEYRYNGFGEKVAQISPDTGTTTFAYNAAGHLIEKVDARQVVTQYRYDVIGRVTDVIYPAANDDNIHYSYDAYAPSVSQAIAANDTQWDSTHLVGRIASVKDASGETHYQYNHRGQVTLQAYNIGNTQYQMAYAYDAVGQLQSATYPSGRQVNYNLEQGRLAGVNTVSSQGKSNTIANSFSHKAFGPLTGLRYGNGSQLQLTRDVNNRIQDILLTGTAANDVLYDVSYLYDGASNITAIEDALAPANSQQFSYDASYRLTAAEGNYGTISYDYDVVGNRQQRSIERLNAQAQLETIQESYTYAQDSNRLLTVAKAGSDGSFKQRDLSYDAVGNIIADTKFGDQRTLNYSANNRLAALEKPAAQDGDLAEYRYNAKGQRVSKTVAGITTHFHYDINKQLVAETQLSTEGQTPVRDYVYAAGMRLAMVDYTSEQTQLGAVQYVVNDHLGTPTVMTNVRQQVVWRANATPFGDQMAAANVQPLRFPGQYADAESGYSYNYFRDYDPSLGRYIQSDPIGLAGGVNTFGYVGGRPLALIDSFGLDAASVNFGVGGTFILKGQLTLHFVSEWDQGTVGIAYSYERGLGFNGFSGRPSGGAFVSATYYTSDSYNGEGGTVLGNIINFSASGGPFVASAGLGGDNLEAIEFGVQRGVGPPEAGLTLSTTKDLISTDLPGRIGRKIGEAAFYLEDKIKSFCK